MISGVSYLTPLGLGFLMGDKDLLQGAVMLRNEIAVE